LTVFGPDENKTKKLMEDFEKKVEIETRPAPEFLYKVFETIKEAFSDLF
jgi:hypothetical protein